MNRLGELKFFGSLFLTILTFYFGSITIKCDSGILTNLQNRKVQALKFLSSKDLFRSLTKDRSDVNNLYNFNIKEEILEQFSFSPPLNKNLDKNSAPKLSSKHVKQRLKSNYAFYGKLKNGWKTRKKPCAKFNICEVSREAKYHVHDDVQKAKRQRKRRNVFNEISVKSPGNPIERDFVEWKSLRHEIRHYNENDIIDGHLLNVSSSDKVNRLWTKNYLVKKRIADSTKLISNRSSAAKDFIIAVLKGLKNIAEDSLEQDYEEDNPEPKMAARKKKKKKKKRKWKKFLLPLLLAYKLKFFALIPVMMGGLVLMVGSTGLAGFFFALFTAVMSLRGSGIHHHG